MINANNRKGMTLIEIIVALAILGFLMLAYLTMFTSSFDHIFRMGNKTSAMADAQDIVDAVYISRNTSDSFIESLSGEDFLKIEDYNQIETEDFSTHRILYAVGSETILDRTYQKLTVKVFYRNGTEHVLLTTIVP